MSKEGELWRTVCQVVGDGGLAVLTTASGEGQPHATWMNAVVGPRLEEVVTATAPGTLKATNIGENAHVEWMYSSPSMETLVYLEGKAEILDEGPEAEACWHQLPDKSQVYFKRYCESDDFRDFALIRTRVGKVVYCRPQGYRKTVVYTEEAAV